MWINKLSTCDHSEYQQKALQIQKELLENTPNSDDVATLNATLIALSSYNFDVGKVITKFSFSQFFLSFRGGVKF